jgi:hypothetical protein
MSLSARVLASVALLTLAGPAFAGATQSNFKKETRKGANYWSGMATHDLKEDTAWMVPGESENVDEWIMFDVPKVAVDAIGMNVGWAKSEETFKDYARVKKVRIEAFEYDDSMELVPAGKPMELEFADEMGLQVVKLTEPLKGDKGTNGKVKIIVKEFYEGRDFPNIAVSEALVFLSEFDVPYEIKEISHEDEKNSREVLLDQNAKTVWVGPAEGASFKISSPSAALSSITLQHAGANYARPKTVELTAQGRSRTVELSDGEPQQLWIPTVFGYTGGSWGDVVIKVLDVYPGKKAADQLGLQEIGAQASNNDAF